MKIEKLDHYGRGITRINNKICFVENALKDEDVLINITKETKKISEAEVKEYLKESINRAKPKCKYYNICGGCNISHLKDIEQEKFKEEKVREIITKFTKQKPLIKDICFDKSFNYRNKVTLHIKNNKLGFFKEKTNEIIDIDKCLLLDDKINDLITVLKEFIIKENSITKITIKLGNITEEIMLSIDGNVNNYNDLIDKVDVLIINNKVITEKNYIISMIGNKKYKVSKNSFFQVNKYITEKLYDEVRSIIEELNSKSVLDLYCGTGTIGIYVADLVNKVVGIEVVSDAIKDANYNKKLNKVNNITFIKGKVEEKINNINDNIDTVILDPPRSGLHKNVVETLKKLKPNNIIYVSCDPVTLARDINLLSDIYEISYIKPFDMFPNTYHVECVCALNRH